MVVFVLVWRFTMFSTITILFKAVLLITALPVVSVPSGPPGPPVIVNVHMKTTSAVLQLTKGSSNGDLIHSYKVLARCPEILKNQTWWTVAEGIKGKEINETHGLWEVELEDVLSPFVMYDFRVAAANKAGYGPPSFPSSQWTTSTDKPYKAPMHLQGEVEPAGNLIIGCTPLGKEDENAQNFRYEFLVRRLAGENPTEITEEEEFTVVTVNSRNSDPLIVNITRKLRHAKYEVKVRAVNAIGNGPESEPIVIYSAEDVPQVAPSRIVANAFNSTAMNISWVEMDSSRVIGYRVKYWRDSDSEESALFSSSQPADSWTLITDLFPNTYYLLRVMAIYSDGDGPQSECIREKTFEKAPPTAVDVKPEKPSAVNVTPPHVVPEPKEEPLPGHSGRDVAYSNGSAATEPVIASATIIFLAIILAIILCP